VIIDAMRIVLSNASSKWGGVHKVTEILARGLIARGHDITVFGYPGRMLEERMRGIAPFIPILKGMDLNPAALLRTGAALRRFDADAVLALTKKDVRLTAVSAAMMGIPVVVRHANQQALGDNFFWRTLYGRIPSLHITNAEATRQTLLSSAPWLEKDRIEVIYNGIDADLYQAAVPLDLGLPREAVVVGFAGSFERRKGVRELALAWHAVSHAIPDAYLVLAGKGSMEDEMRTLLDTAPRVCWIGYRKDIPQVLKALDLMVLPSHVEGAPNIVLEAMSAGTAIVATAVSGTPELVRDGVEARLTPPRNPEKLAAALVEMLTGEELRNRMKVAAFSRVKAEFGIDRMLDSYEEALGRVISAKPTRKS
jgi:glycosyltransferase involved in cell wall biosynthesis